MGRHRHERFAEGDQQVRSVGLDLNELERPVILFDQRAQIGCQVLDVRCLVAGDRLNVYERAGEFKNMHRFFWGEGEREGRRQTFLSSPPLESSSGIAPALQVTVDWLSPASPNKAAAHQRVFVSARVPK